MQSLFFYIWHMKIRWYIGTLIVIFTVLGVTNHQQIPLANQEIVLNFTHPDVKSNESQNIIAFVKKQLQAIGVNHIRVEEKESGSLKIIYYSDTDVANVKKALSEGKNLLEVNMTSEEEKSPAKSPFSNDPKTYNLDVFEIHKQDLETGFDGKYAIELKTEYNRFFISNLNVFNNEIDARHLESAIKEAFNFCKNITIALDNTSHKIPEVRAGPCS